MTCMARNSDEIWTQVPASTGDHTKMFFSRQKNLSLRLKNPVSFLTTLHVFKKYACEKVFKSYPKLVMLKLKIILDAHMST